jgi:hypothetical protein
MASQQPMAFTVTINAPGGLGSKGADVVSKELTLSEELIAELPRSVRAWKAQHLVKWLAEVFAGADDLPT